MQGCAAVQLQTIAMCCILQSMSMPRVFASVPEATMNALKEAAKREKRKVANYIRVVLDEHAEMLAKRIER